MRGGRRKLPVLAEIAGPAPGETRVWSLRRADLTALAKLQEGLEPHCAVLVSGAAGLTGAVAIAAAASAAGRSTALLECDLVRPSLAAELGLIPAPGLHEYLRWEATATEILQPLVLGGPASSTATDPLICVVAGRPAADAATLVGLDSFRHALAKLRSAYDLVILAGPGLDTGDGALQAIATQADTLVAAVSSAEASGRPGRGLRATLSRLPLDPRGAILVGAA